MSLRKCFVAAVALALAGVVVPSAHANLVTNGDFSAGFTGWTVSGWSDFGDTAVNSCVGATCITGGTTSGAYLYQDLATTVGDSYTLSFLFQAFGGNPMEFKVLFGNTVVTDIVNGGSIPESPYTFTNLIANSTTTRLLFLGRDDPGTLDLNSVDVEPATSTVPAVPEPGTMALVGTGLLSFLGIARRRFC